MRISDWSSDVCSSDLLVDLAVGSIELQPVAIKGNVAAGHHYRRNPLRDGVQGQRRGRQHSATLGLQACGPYRCHHRRCDPRTAWTQVPADRDPTKVETLPGHGHESQDASGPRPVGPVVDPPPGTPRADGTSVVEGTRVSVR